VGAGFARVRNISISNVTIESVDPRYAILLAGLVDHPIENVYIGNVTVEYRGGLKMEHAVEQRQLNQSYSYTAYQSASATQTLPWLANTFFSKNEALLPRISWNPALNGGAGAWEGDPYNVPEMPREYPEPSLLGVLPAYGIYARHVKGLTVENVSLQFKVEDERPAVVLDDVDAASFQGFTASIKAGVPVFVNVTNTKKREAVREYVKDVAYKTTTVTNLAIPQGLTAEDVTIVRPAPGTPPDTLYALPTAPSATNPYAYVIPNATYPKPLTVYRPFFDAIVNPSISENQPVQLLVNANTVAAGVTLAYSAEQLPRGATFDSLTRTFNWTPDYRQAGTYTVRFIVDDGVIPETKEVVITVADVPSGELIDTLTVYLVGLGLPQGTENSLTAKLDNARKSWARGDNGAAIIQVSSFIDEVKAQSGKKIPAAQAAELIRQASLIAYSLG